MFVKKREKNINDVKKPIRIALLVILDVVAVNLAMFFALFLRFEFDMLELQKSGFLEEVFSKFHFFTLITVLVFAVAKLYVSLWEFASIEEAIRIVIASAAAVCVQVGILVISGTSFPRSFPVLYFVFLAIAVALIRVLYRKLRKHKRRIFNEPLKRTMVIGAGEAGYIAINEFLKSERSQNYPVCVIDDDISKRNQFIHGVKIVGNRYAIPDAAEKYDVEEIIFAIPTASNKDKKEILEICQQTKCSLKTMPAIYQIVNNDVSVNNLRDIEIEDLLGRDPVITDLDEVEKYLKDKIILVTGGGGSIGSELCRQIATYSPKTLIIFDIYENNAYAIQMELLRRYPDMDIQVLIGSVRDKARVEKVFDQFRPEIVFHAAAHKHVPLMEDSPGEAVKNNIFGTINVADAADKYKTKRFVLISTDKAVNPTNIMGATKRVCEMVIQMKNRHSDTEYVAVRFGNVLGSNGSVVPLFKEQIKNGGPVTVTHPDIIRYFMTIPEAVSLVLQAEVHAKGGEIFVLDMGDPVKIDDLARKMIRLSGFEPGVDIEIKYVGLRPGEKLYEEVLMSEEGLSKTPNELIYVGKELELDEEKFSAQLQQLRQAEDDSDELRWLIRQVVTTFREPEIQ